MLARERVRERGREGERERGSPQTALVVETK